jgi:hypothetical protein
MWSSECLTGKIYYACQVPLLWEFEDEQMRLSYPADHKVGMVVPRGGSSCAKCEYVRNNRRDCAQPDFVAWNKSPVLPAPANEYCCDFFEAK